VVNAFHCGNHVPLFRNPPPERAADNKALIFLPGLARCLLYVFAYEASWLDPPTRMGARKAGGSQRQVGNPAHLEYGGSYDSGLCTPLEATISCSVSGFSFFHLLKTPRTVL